MAKAATSTATSLASALRGYAQQAWDAVPAQDDVLRGFGPPEDVAEIVKAFIPQPQNIVPGLQSLGQGMQSGDLNKMALGGALALGGAIDMVPGGRAANVAGRALAGAVRKAPRGSRHDFDRPDIVLPMDEASRMARAKEAGFRLDMDLYHGTDQDIKAFDPRRRYYTPGDTRALTGVSSALNPVVAAEFANLAAQRGQGSGQNIIQLLHRADRPTTLRLRGDEAAHEVQATLEHAFANGYDAVLLKNYTTPAGMKGQNIIIVKDPAQLRSPRAAFDPKKRNSRDLLASATGTLGLGAAVATADKTG